MLIYLLIKIDYCSLISSIDISGINAGKVYLGFNKFTSITDITFPRVIYNTDLYVVAIPVFSSTSMIIIMFI